jgi:hypothetical protein
MAKRNSKRGNYTYEPTLSGWVAVHDKLSRITWHSEHCLGNAQQAFQDKLDALQREGWAIESRFADSVFANRGDARVHVSIISIDPATVSGAAV